MASKFKKRKSELNKKRLYSLILIFLMISSVLAFVVIYGGGSSSNSFNGFDLYPSPNGYSLIIPELNLEIYNHPQTLGLTQYGFNQSNIVRDRIKSATTIALTSSFNSSDRVFTDEFKFYFDTRTDLFEGQLISTGFTDGPNAITCDSDYDLIIDLQQKNYSSVELNNNCLSLSYPGVFEANQMIETLILYRTGVLE